MGSMIGDKIKAIPTDKSLYHLFKNIEQFEFTHWAISVSDVLSLKKIKELFNWPSVLSKVASFDSINNFVNKINSLTHMNILF